MHTAHTGSSLVVVGHNAESQLVAQAVDCTVYLPGLLWRVHMSGSAPLHVVMLSDGAHSGSSPLHDHSSNVAPQVYLITSTSTASAECSQLMGGGLF